jgi:hypothetical protein
VWLRIIAQLTGRSMRCQLDDAHHDRGTLSVRERPAAGAKTPALRWPPSVYDKNANKLHLRRQGVGQRRLPQNGGLTLAAK